MKMKKPERVLVRPVSESYPGCLRQSEATIDLEAARAQHAGYVEAIQKLGISIEWLPELDAEADAVFVEDTAVVLNTTAVMTCPGAVSRRAEVPSVRTALHTRFEMVDLDLPCTLDGGDVLRAGPTLFIGRSSRTNPEGIAALARVASDDGLSPVVAQTKDALHLKSVVTLVDDDRVILLNGTIDRSIFESRGLRCLETEEPHGANVLALGDDLLVSAAAPKTAEALARDHRIHVVSVDQFHLGDGALTCLSIRLPPSDGWVT